MMDFELDPVKLVAEKAPDLRARIHQLYLCDEQDYVHDLMDCFPEQQDVQFKKKVESLIHTLKAHHSQSVLHQLLQEYDLSTEEGIILMCLAETLIRIPDSATANDLIIDKLAERGWQHHVNKSTSFWVNAASWGLALTGKMLKPKHRHPSEAITGLINKLTLKITREAVQRAIRILGLQFVYAESIEEAIQHKTPYTQSNVCCSYDMLGEAALTEALAKQYFDAYDHAISKVAKDNQSKKGKQNSISIKLSALHPRYEPNQQREMLPALITRLLKLVTKAKDLDVPITIDAEEQYRLDISLHVFESVLSHQTIANWGKLGLAVQSYGKRALSVLHWLHCLGDKLQITIPVRLVKGAYWDTEIKWAQELGLSEYPVFTQKASTDLNYITCARFLLHANQRWLYPMFATHNAWTALAILEMPKTNEFEFQRLHGMGEALFEHLMTQYQVNECIYAPVGCHRELLPYLVRRLIENGANSSFVFQIQDPQVALEKLVEHPVDLLEQTSILNPNIPLPSEIFVDYPNSRGFELQHDHVYFSIMDKVSTFKNKKYRAAPLFELSTPSNIEAITVNSPVNGDQIGYLHSTQTEHCHQVISFIKDHPFKVERLSTLTKQVDQIADIMIANRDELIYLCMNEAGKTLANAIAELREGVDFCRYYSRQAQKNFADPHLLDSITGEENLLRYRPRGNVLCISPWNFSLSIFVGQISAALACGNRVIAKPARQTSLIAQRLTELIFEAGLFKNQLIFLPGDGEAITKPLIESRVIDMVCFTGSTRTAKVIQNWIVESCPKFVNMLAETGGQNIMVADSTILIDQLVPDVITSAFDSAGQRCSALRVLMIQEDVKADFYQALKGRMALINVDSPFYRETDIGPIIDSASKHKLEQHIQWLNEHAKLIATTPLPKYLQETDSHQYVAPCAYEIENLNQINEEHFGPILHIIPFNHDNIDEVISSINQSGFGLTMGIQSRNERWIDYIASNVDVGNIYINRPMIGAKVGAQPFGGHGLSGTGPKTGGPNYVHAFVKEFTTTTNTSAFGGNQELLS